jgi:prevent-host-death family protein
MDQVPMQAAMSVGAYDAKTRLSELLDRVENGEQIVITLHGKPIARLVPEGGHDRVAARAAVARLFALGEQLARQGVNLTDEEIRALRDEGRR